MPATWKTLHLPSFRFPASEAANPVRNVKLPEMFSYIINRRAIFLTEYRILRKWKNDHHMCPPVMLQDFQILYSCQWCSSHVAVKVTRGHTNNFPSPHNQLSSTRKTGLLGERPAWVLLETPSVSQPVHLPKGIIKCERGNFIIMDKIDSRPCTKFVQISECYSVFSLILLCTIWQCL